VLLIWACLVLLPFGRLVEVPVLCMAVAGIVLLLRHRAALVAMAPMRTFVLVFAAMWLPMVLSLPDAVSPQRTTIVVVNHLRFALSGVFIVWALARPRACQRLLALCGCLLAFWVVDAGVQLALGVDLLGREPSRGRLSGLFGAGSRKLGTTLGVLVPLLWIFVQERYRPWVLWLTIAASVLIVLAAGARAGWVSALVCGIAFAWLNREHLLRHRGRALAAAVVVVVVLPFAAYQTVPSVRQRVDQSISELTGREAVQSSPLGHRAWILKGALAMIAANPINGVGARGFRHAFPEYAAEGDPFVAQSPPIYPMHSHQLLVEIASETGLIGVAGLALALTLLAREAWRAQPPVRARIAPYGIALCAALVPFNTHLAIYSAHFSQIVWWLIAVYCACLAHPPTQAHQGACSTARAAP